MKRNVLINLGGERGIEGHELVELVVRTGMAIAGSFFQMWESHKITCKAGVTNLQRAAGHKTKVVRGGGPHPKKGR